MIRLVNTDNYPNNLTCFICKLPINIGDEFRVFENNNRLKLFQADSFLSVEAIEVTHDINKTYRMNICKNCFENNKDNQ